MTRLYPESGQCIPFARAKSGLQVSGAAISVPVNSSTPEEGSIVITNESRAGHAGVVTKVTDSTIEIIERNYIPGWITKRILPKNFARIKGFVL